MLQKQKPSKWRWIGSIICICVPGLLLLVFLGSTIIQVFRLKGASTARMRVSGNLKQIGIAAHTYEDKNKHLPKFAIFEGEKEGKKNGKALLNWRVTLSPYLEQEELYKKFRLDESWDSPHNIKLLEKMPPVYAHPLDEEANSKGDTYFQGFVSDRKFNGSNPLFMDRAWFSCAIRSMMDGPSNTIMIAEASKPVPWTKPADILYDNAKPVPKLGLFESHFIVLLVDGSVQPIPRTIDDVNLSRLITINDGFNVEIP